MDNNNTNLQLKNIEAEDEKELAAKEFAAEIKRLRLKAGLSQKTLGALIGEEQTIMSRIELASYGVTLDLVIRLAVAFNDNPHRLADIYWGIDSRTYDNANKAVLDKIWDLIYPHYQPIPDMPPPQPGREHSEQTKSEIVRARAENKKMTAARKAAMQPKEPETISTQETENKG